MRKIQQTRPKHKKIQEKKRRFNNFRNVNNKSMTTFGINMITSFIDPFFFCELERKPRRLEPTTSGQVVTRYRRVFWNETSAHKTIRMKYSDFEKSINRQRWTRAEKSFLAKNIKSSAITLIERVEGLHSRVGLTQTVYDP